MGDGMAESTWGPRRWVSLRSVVLGAVMSVVVGLQGPYWTIYLQTSRMYADYHTGGAAFWLFMLIPFFLLFNLAVGRGSRLAWRAEELTVVTAMMFISGSIVSSGLIGHWLPSISAACYHATSGNQWRELVWDNLRPWMRPIDPDGGNVAVTQFWEGLPPGEPIPWGPWVRPLVAWGVLLLGLFACMTAIMAIMRKQWVDHEHLSFPIAQVPAELCAGAVNPLRESSIFRSKAFWVGLGMAFLVASMGGVSFYAFGKPFYFRIRQTVTGLGPLGLRVNTSLVVIGLAFLIPNRIAFSVVALSLMSWGTKSFMRAYNLGMRGGDGSVELGFLTMGAMVMFVLASVWLGRRHLRRVLRCGLGTGDRDYDAEEPCSYRSALLTMLAGMAVFVGWLVAAGLGLGYALCVLAAFLVIYYGMARVIAQCGLPSATPPVIPARFVGDLFGVENLGTRQVALLGSQVWHADMRNGAMSGAAHSMYLVQRRRSGLFWALLLALVVTYVTACYCTVWISYRHGALNMDPWFFMTSSRIPWWWVSGTLGRQEGFSLLGLSWTVFGGLIMGALILAQRSFFWWPIHPVAFLICNSHMVYNLWFSVFLAWLAKVLVVNFGGHRAYRSGRRFCIGMVMGYFLGGGLWGIVDTVTGKVGNAVFYL